ncbi:hypothetical protein EXIGLDRAFT_95275 [Exidia glandulosa HHB12029]|uniref:Uncharacterized protein n=1 Tax=Exidia glandulosa HHB12029 TaxID=1314781 RepID=A0A165H7L1_EXIGL|nr:hypothetical protein EXIGLDRAFT_95275 [Exidia glandulosa HHB12029]
MNELRPLSQLQGSPLPRSHIDVVVVYHGHLLNLWEPRRILRSTTGFIPSFLRLTRHKGPRLHPNIRRPHDARRQLEAQLDNVLSPSEQGLYPYPQKYGGVTPIAETLRHLRVRCPGLSSTGARSGRFSRFSRAQIDYSLSVTASTFFTQRGLLVLVLPHAMPLRKVQRRGTGAWLRTTSLRARNVPYSFSSHESIVFALSQQIAPTRRVLQPQLKKARFVRRISRFVQSRQSSLCLHDLQIHLLSSHSGRPFLLSLSPLPAHRVVEVEGYALTGSIILRIPRPLGSSESSPGGDKGDVRDVFRSR